MVRLVRTEHHRAGSVAVSLVGRYPGDPDVIAPGRVRVVESAVADRLDQLVAAGLAHRAAGGTATPLDLDALVARAERDVAGFRARLPEGR